MFYSKLFISILWPTMPKAFEKSIGTPNVNYFSLKNYEIRLESCKLKIESQTVFHIKFYF